MAAHIWPDGTTIFASTWHFHRNLYRRYKGTILRPGEFSAIGRAIRNKELKPFRRIKDQPVAVYRYERRTDGGKKQVLFLVAEKHTGLLISAYRPKWVHRTH